MKLNTKLFLIILQVSLIPWALGGFLAYLTAGLQIDSRTYSTLNAIASIQSARLQNTIADKLDELSVVTSNAELRTAMDHYAAQPTPALQKAIQAQLLGFLRTSVQMHAIYVASNAGIVIASTDPSLLGTDIHAYRYFIQGKQAPDASELEKDASGAIVQYLAGPLRTTETTSVGVVVAETDANDILAIAHDYAGLGKTGETLLVEQTASTTARFLIPTRFDPNAALTRTVPLSTLYAPTHLSADQEAVFLNQTDYRNVEVIAATRYIDRVHWNIIVKIDKAEAHIPVSNLGSLFIAIISMVGLLMIFIGLSIARSITDPVKTLTTLANRIAEGDLQQSILVTSRDEIGVLGAAFNSMSQKLKEANDTLEKRVDERTRALEEKTEEAEKNEKAAFNIASDLKTEEEKLAEEKVNAERLANDLTKFKLALDGASDMVLITDNTGTVIYGNPAIERVTGYKPEEALGKKAGALWRQPMPDEYYKNFWHTIEDLKQPFIGEIQNKRKNGELYTAMFSASPVLDKSGNVLFYVGLERDITKEKEIDIAKSEFISLASHQMRTPLTAINWYTEMLLGGDAGALTAKQQEYFNEVYMAAQRMNEIIKSFLHILRLETGTVSINMAAVDVTALAQTAIKELQVETQRRNVHIVEHYEDALPNVHTDAELVHIIMQNLISNGIKYSPADGSVTVAIARMPHGSSAAGKPVTDDSVLVSVRDNGIGISEADKEKIFTKFFRAENAKKMDPNGNGIGLYMAKFMVNIVGGSLWFDSQDGKGTTFYLLLPLEGKRLV